MKIFMTLIFAMTFCSFAQAQDIKIGTMVISCQNEDNGTGPTYGVTVFGETDGTGILILNQDGEVILKQSVTVAGNGDTFATADAKDLLFFVDAEDFDSGKIEFLINGQKQSVLFAERECSDMPSNWPLDKR